MRTANVDRALDHWRSKHVSRLLVWCGEVCSRCCGISEVSGAACNVICRATGGSILIAAAQVPRALEIEAMLLTWSGSTPPDTSLMAVALQACNGAMCRAWGLPRTS